LFVANLFLIVRSALAVEGITLCFGWSQIHPNEQKVGYFSNITPGKFLDIILHSKNAKKKITVKKKKKEYEI
jgi:hypothetical protein